MGVRRRTPTGRFRAKRETRAQPEHQRAMLAHDVHRAVPSTARDETFAEATRKSNNPPFSAIIHVLLQTLHEWIRKHEFDTGLRDGATSTEREVREHARPKKL
jgi:hypothetical protein